MGRHVPDRGGPGRAEGAGVRRPLPPGALPHRADRRGRRRAGRHRDHPARADPERRGADHPPRRRALPVAGGKHGDLAGLRRRDPCRRAPRGRAGQGHRPGHVLHLRRPHRRAVVARAAAAGADGHRARRPADPRHPAVDVVRAGRDGVRRDGGQDGVLRARGDGRAAARERRPGRRAVPDDAHDELLRERRQAAGDRRHPAVVHPQRRPRRRAARVRWSRTAHASSGCPRT